MNNLGLLDAIIDFLLICLAGIVGLTLLSIAAIAATALILSVWKGLI